MAQDYPTQVIVAESALEDIADAIRDKLSVATTYKPGDMAAAIASISVGGANLACGTITATQDGVMNIEHNLGQRPTIWGLRPTGKYNARSYVRYEALERVYYYFSSSDGVEEASIYATSDISSWATTNTRMYRQNLAASAVRPDNSTPFPSTTTAVSVNNKYIGMRFFTSTTISAFLKTGVEYFWFALITNQTP